MRSNFNDLKNENMNLELERFLENQTEMLGNLTITDSIDVETLTDICEEYHKRKLKLLGIAVVVGQSEQYFCSKEQIGQRCNEQCLGCFQFENKD